MWLLCAVCNHHWHGGAIAMTYLTTDRCPSCHSSGLPENPVVHPIISKDITKIRLMRP